MHILRRERDRRAIEWSWPAPDSDSSRSARPTRFFWPVKFPAPAPSAVPRVHRAAPLIDPVVDQRVAVGQARRNLHGIKLVIRHVGSGEFPDGFALRIQFAQPILRLIAMAARRFAMARSTFRAASPFCVQLLAMAVSSLSEYGLGLPASKALSNLCVTISGKRRFGAVEWV